MATREEYRRLADMGYTARQAADELGVGINAIYMAETKHGLAFKREIIRRKKTIPAFTVKQEAIARYVAASKAKQSRQPRPGG